MFESHLRQLIFLRKSDCLGCAVLLCLVCLFDLAASFFLPFLTSLKHVIIAHPTMPLYTYIYITDYTIYNVVYM